MEEKKEIKVIDWWDSKIEIGEFDENDSFDWATMTSIGFVIYESEFVITLAQDFRGDANTYRTTITIPKCSVERIYSLEEYLSLESK